MIKTTQKKSKLRNILVLAIMVVYSNVFADVNNPNDFTFLQEIPLQRLIKGWQDITYTGSRVGTTEFLIVSFSHGNPECSKMVQIHKHAVQGGGWVKKVTSGNDDKSIEVWMRVVTSENIASLGQIETKGAGGIHGGITVYNGIAEVTNTADVTQCSTTTIAINNNGVGPYLVIAGSDNGTPESDKAMFHFSPGDDRVFVYLTTDQNFSDTTTGRLRGAIASLALRDAGDPAPPIVTDFWDDADANANWNPGSLVLNTSDKKQGASCLEFSGSATPEFYKVFSTPYDAQGTESATQLKFWYYVSDPSLFEVNNQVEISSSGKGDVDEYHWKLSGLNAGWNFIQLHTNEAVKTGSPDLSAINWFRIYRFKTGVVTTRIDAIQLIGENKLAVEDIKIEHSVSVFPNPVKTELFVNFELSKSSDVSVAVLDVYGKIVLQKIDNERLSQGNHKRQISVDKLRSGMYLVRIKIEDKIVVKKMLVE